MKTLMSSLILATTTALSATAVTSPALAQDASITIVVENVRPEGTIDAALFVSAEGWDETGPVASGRADTASGRVEITFDGLEPGEYAIRLYHDENADGSFNMNFMGIPTEGYGFSNNPFPRFRGARFDEAVFTVAAGETREETVELMGGGYW
ncbi:MULTISPECIES: DUF2141 domain-containing protein [Hyphobacterium]|uniref:DUF2141 domain-containing protein n=1 Tax=Hyphobacterium vulgare TaxID=1736751 RepID=A0ABV6ZVY1_9PROT